MVTSRPGYEHLALQVTVNANGEVTAEIENFRVECK
jgi:hypothetical protein